MMRGVSVRARQAADLVGCVQALAAVHGVDGYPACWPPDPVAWLNPAGLVGAWVVEHAGVVAGHVGMVHGEGDPTSTVSIRIPGHHLASVTRLFVVPQARGRGVGTRLMEQVSDQAAEQGLRLVLDVVDDGGPALALYDRLGWRMVDHRPAEWLTPDGRRPTLRMYLAPDRPPAWR
jgi:GNAT superfamily N-acetyltransferase